MMQFNRIRIIRLTTLGLIGAILFDILKYSIEVILDRDSWSLVDHYRYDKADELILIITGCALGLAVLTDITEAIKSVFNRYEIHPFRNAIRRRKEKELLRYKAMLDAGAISEEEYKDKVDAYRSYIKKY